MSRLARPGGIAAVDVGPNDRLARVRATGSKVRVVAFDERDRAVVTPRGRVGAAGEQEVLAGVVVDAQRRRSQGGAVGDRPLREGLAVVDSPDRTVRWESRQLSVPTTNQSCRSPVTFGVGPRP